MLREPHLESLSRQELVYVDKVRLACQELKLDIRDYEYAETRTEQEKWASIAQHNLAALHHYLMLLDQLFSPADIAELGSSLDTIRSELT